MSRFFFRVAGTVSLLIILFAVILVLLQYRLTAHSIETVSIARDATQDVHAFDQLLIKNISRLARGQLLDTLLDNAEYQVDISPVSLSRCQVQQGQYNAFAQWAQFTNQLHLFRHPHAPEDEVLVSRFIKHKLLGRNDSPVTGISYYQASAYCRAAGGRLPTNDEWEAAASGQERRLYPWGNSFNAAFWRFRNPILNVIKHCDAYPDSATPEGILDMGNSVSEWTTNKATGGGILKGGNAFNRPYSLHALNIINKSTPQDFSSQFVGFRCAFDSNNDQPVRLPWKEKHKIVAVQPGAYTLGIPKTARLPHILATLPRASLPHIAETLHQNSKQAPTNGNITVSRYEITVSEYAWFLRDPLARFNYYANENQPDSHSYIPDDWQEQQQISDAPVTGISWWDAYAFATWAGARLPTVKEWNSWYGGSNGFIYPWGDQYLHNKALIRDSDQNTFDAQAVAISQDANDYGLTGLAGNVSEWTSSLYIGSGEQSMIIKGGNFLLDGKESARVDYIARAPLYHRSRAIGFRIVFQ